MSIYHNFLTIKGGLGGFNAELNPYVCVCVRACVRECVRVHVCVCVLGVGGGWELFGDDEKEMGHMAILMLIY